MTLLVLMCLFLFLFPGGILALELRLENYPGSIDPAAESEITVSLICSSCSDSYLRAAFFSQSGNYFGLTKNNSGQFIGISAEKTAYFLVTQDDVKTGSWSGTLRIKIDSDNKYFSGPDRYDFKVIRYTSSGSKSGETESVSIDIVGPTSTPVPSPTFRPTAVPTSTQPTSTPRPRASSTPVAPVSTSTPKPSPTSKPIAVASPTIYISPATPSSQVLGLQDPTEIPSSEATPSSTGSPSLLLPIIFWSAGLILVLASAYLSFA